MNYIVLCICLSRLVFSSCRYEFESIRLLIFFFFKQKTAYEMRISDWSSDVCSSDLRNKAGQIIGASKIARDISDKIHREQTIQFHAKKLETLHAIGKIITEKLDTPSLIQTVINSTTHLAAAAVGICFYRVGDELGQSKRSVAANRKRVGWGKRG